MFQRPKIIVAYVFAIPLALILGILAASPDRLTFFLLGMLFFFLALPLIIKWHHAFLIAFWASVFSAFFLPGQPPFWLVFAGLSFGVSLLSQIMGRRPFLSAPEMVGPIVMLTLVVVGTACLRGGIGLRALGAAAQGGRYYMYVLGAIVGYFALTAGHISLAKSEKMSALYFLSGTTYALSNLAYALGPAFYVMYNFVPAGLAAAQAASDFGLTSIDRISGLGPACNAALLFLLARYGIRGLFQYSKPWRFLGLSVVMGASFFAGFRSVFIGLCLLLFIQFVAEGLVRTRLFPVALGLGAAFIVLVFLFANKLPLVVQRTVSFLPLNVDASVRADSLGTSEWRFQMWSVVGREIPKYLWLGKGYGFDGAEMDLTMDAIRLGLLNNVEEAMLAGDYHSGPLSVIIPFGIWGAIAFLWVLGAGLRVLYLNYRYGDARLRKINSVLLSYYIASIIMFFFVFGALDSELTLFLGAVGFGVSLNGGVSRKPKTGLEQGDAPLAQAYAMELN
jgi:hypothetical protein